MRVDAAVVLGCALLAGSASATAPHASAVVTLALVVLLLRIVRPSLLALGLATFLCGALRGRGTLDAFEARRLAARDAIGASARCAGVGQVIRSPVRVSGDVRLVVDAVELDCEGKAIGRARLKLYGGPDRLGRGDRVGFVAQLAPVRLFRNLELADPTPAAARAGVVLSGGALSIELLEPSSGAAAWIDRARGHARERIEATFAPAAAPMARALVIGENDLEPGDDVAFRESGLSHMLAVSGTHLVFAVLGVLAGLRALLVRCEFLSARYEVERMVAAVGVPLSIVYADFAGGSGSAWRAAYMLAAVLGARALGRRPSAGRSLGLSLVVAGALDPLFAFDVSLLLSAAATTGLVALGAPLARRCQRIVFRPLRALALSIAATCSSMVPCAPLLALLSPNITLAGILANVVAAPFGEAIALPLCLLHALLAPVPCLERGVALVGSGALLVMKSIAWTSAQARWLAFPVPPPTEWHFAVLALGSVALWASPRRASAAFGLLVGLACVELAARRAGAPVGALRVTVLDVEQGDSLLVDLPDGALMLIDGGGFVGSPVDTGARVVTPLLRARRRSRIDIAVLTHPHPDHVLGLVSALRGFPVGELWDNGQGERHDTGPAYASLLEDMRRRGVAVRRPRDLCGSVRAHGGAALRVLAPCPDVPAGATLNDGSLVIRLTLGSRAALLVGDAEAEAEARLLQSDGRALRSDLLKVGHHGSRTSSGSAFLSAVRPALAVVSSGVRNRHGHPHHDAIERLWRAGAQVARTDRAGSITWWTDGERVTWTGFALPR